jgi:hypothetical protein
MHPLTALVCGNATAAGAISEVHAHLSNSLDRLLVRSRALKRTGDPVDLALFGPVLGRATIEVGITAILARFDPFRVLAIRKSQLSTDYDTKIRNPLAFNWANDVQGEEKPKLWTARPGIKDLQRAVLCKHFNDVFWQEAFEIMTDAVPYSRGDTWMANLKRVSPEGFTVLMRTDADRLYSELSKGVHHEFVIAMTAQYDAATVGDLLGRSWEMLAALGVTACHSPAVKPLQDADPLDLYEEAQKELLA